MSREFLRLTVESAYKTAKVTPTAGTDQIIIRLDGSNGFTMREAPLQTSVMYGGGFAVEAAEVSTRQEVKGALQVKLCYSQAALLMGLLMRRINSGQTTPWVTTEPVGDLASVTVDHAIFQDDTGTYLRKTYEGIKASGGSAECSEDNPIVQLNLDLMGSTVVGNSFDASSDPDATAFPVPAETDYVSDFVLFTHLDGAVAVNGAQVDINSFKFNIQNKMDGKYFTKRYLKKLRFYGRATKLDLGVPLYASPNERLALEARTAFTTTAAFTNAVNTLTLNLHSKNKFEKVDDSLDLDKMYSRTLSVKNIYDSAAAADVDMTYG